ncbi:putative quinol monooxygenase [Rhizobium johnstonii]|uniref:Antibiotic biosynthesis monooxygenase n=1 Tax=Rhizobium leguminosarum TaxID=384 RepID=A0A7K3VV25_RHILE|nr:putative quinol monooxygenase [Rhizobium leguminosarum]MBB4510019.1 quinol monooxygenase YgiN [Rhizobium leguminosarum]MBY5374505.1 antibiotic biosynthesis monooxygenase [Rhizobium leguminosarum]MBY5415472.1 antibiotic biosynthesis monooxygenase [Rhizobium leguminosarum]NEI02031.1 antibiotic biosynthesis monooxygenase [Rhizobium leguminosarum]NEI54818.1 antibiotic biosynthesis monooxygenase [Rhizobium leguminosarum]
MTNVKVYAVLTAKSGKEKELEELLRGMAAPSRTEAGNLRYDLWRDTAVLGRFILDEMYVDAEANSSHRESPHFQNYVGKINELADRSVYLVTSVDVVGG